jgi:hypothetical protein
MTETQKKGTLKGISIMLTFIVFILTFSNILFYSNFQNQITILNNQVNSLQNQITTISDEKANLQSQLISINTTYQNYLVNHSHSNTEYDNLQSEYDNYVTIHHYTDSEYNSLLDYKNRYISAYYNIRDTVNKRVYGGKAENCLSFITLTDPRVIQVVHEITGGWSKSSDWNEFWNDVEAMYFWVRNNIQYCYDGLSPILPIEPWGSVWYNQNFFQFPNETLFLRTGDCEDQAILLCSMINCYSGASLAEVIDISGTISSHLAVQIPVEGDQLVILDPAGNYYSHNFWGNIISEDLRIAVNKWLDYWKPSIGEETYVSQVFSDQMVKYFLSTSEYLNWMYNR